MKSVKIRSFFWSVIFCIQSKHRKIWTRKNSVFGHFSQQCPIFRVTTDQIKTTLICNVLLFISSVYYHPLNLKIHSIKFTFDCFSILSKFSSIWENLLFWLVDGSYTHVNRNMLLLKEFGNIFNLFIRTGTRFEGSQNCSVGLKSVYYVLDKMRNV